MFPLSPHLSHAFSHVVVRNLLAESPADEIAVGVERNGERYAELGSSEREIALAVGADDHLGNREFEADRRLYSDTGDVADHEPFAGAAHSEANFLVCVGGESEARRHLRGHLTGAEKAIATASHAVGLAESERFDMSAKVTGFSQEIGPFDGNAVRKRVVDLLADRGDSICGLGHVAPIELHRLKWRQLISH